MNFPDDTQRLVIVGMTGSGKTHAAAWHLSGKPYDEYPWMVYDWKRDPLIAEVQGIREIGVNEKPPQHPGLYVVRPNIDDDDDQIDRQMTEIWNQGDTGVYIDEGYMIDRRNKGYRKLLTQGRSKHIPMIVLCTRPTWMDKFTFTESEFKQVFRLQSDQDIQKIQEYIPFDLTRRLPKHWSYYYDAPDDQIQILKPVPDKQVILNIFHAKLDAMVNKI